MTRGEKNKPKKGNKQASKQTHEFQRKTRTKKMEEDERRQKSRRTSLKRIYIKRRERARYVEQSYSLDPPSCILS